MEKVELEGKLYNMHTYVSVYISTTTIQFTADEYSIVIYGQFPIEACFLDYRIERQLDSYDEMKID